MSFKKYCEMYSYPRMMRYLNAAGGKKTLAKKMYVGNLRLAQAVHPLLGTFEVLLRNRICFVLESSLGDKEWILNQKTGLLDDISLRKIDPATGKRENHSYFYREIEKAQKKITRDGRPVTSDAVVAELTFGFWSNLYEAGPYKLLKGAPIAVFSGKPKSVGRKDIWKMLDEIRRFRNRVSHNEPVCFDSGKYSLASFEIVYSELCDCTSYIEKNQIRFLRHTGLDNVKDVISSLKK